MYVCIQNQEKGNQETLMWKRHTRRSPQSCKFYSRVMQRIITDCCSRHWRRQTSQLSSCPSTSQMEVMLRDAAYLSRFTKRNWRMVVQECAWATVSKTRQWYCLGSTRYAPLSPGRKTIHCLKHLLRRCTMSSQRSARLVAEGLQFRIGSEPVRTALLSS